MARRKVEIRFVYAKNKLKWGSTIMRAHQMCRIANMHLGDKYDFGLVSLPNRKIPGLQRLWVKTQKPGIVYIFTKGTKYGFGLNKNSLIELHKKSGGICFDYVDSNLSKLTIAGIDIHIACSFSAKNAIQQILRKRSEEGLPASGDVMLLLHNVDQRLYGLNFTPKSSLKSVYFGTKKQTLLTEHINEMLDFIDASNTENMEKNYRFLEKYNFHYCVRSSTETGSVRIHKPFTKGFTAAVCKSNLIVNSGVDDAIEFLTEDYPYMVNSINEREIIEVMQKSSSTFGKREWINARRIMEKVAERVSSKAIAEQLAAVLTRLGH